jgi:peptidoglycan DL-endopeptidase CwlO
VRFLRNPSVMRFAACVVALFVLSSSAVYAVPSTPQIAAKQAEAAKAQAKLDEFRTDLEFKVEEYDKIDSSLQKTRALIDQTRARLQIEDTNLQKAQELLNSRADGIYRGGNVDMLEVVLGTTSFEDFLTRIDLMARIGNSDAQIVGDVKDARQRVKETKRALDQRETEQVALRDQVAAKKQQVEVAVGQQKQFLDSLNGQVAQLIKKEEARIAAEAEAKARALAAANAAAARLAAGRGGAAISGGRAADGVLGVGHPEAVRVAMKYIGVPYVWGGTDPSGFDCSGLCQYVYHQLGIDIPRVAQDQYFAGKHIPADRLDMLRPGDLLFFGRGRDPNSVHHVVMFAGGDDIIEAPYTGANVRVASLATRLSHGEYVGASRF